MYVCENCYRKFLKPVVINTTYESFYGVSMEFLSHTPMTYRACPYCESTEFYKKGEIKNEQKNY